MEQSINTRKLAAEKAVAYVESGMLVGLGTGSTAYWAIQLIGERVREGLEIKSVATSAKSEQMARELGIPVISFAETGHLDVTIDGADETDASLNLIKGGGGALLREKIVASATKFYIIIADESKLVDHLGAFPLPVEVVRFGFELTRRRLQDLGCNPQLRMAGDKPFETDNGNFIFDCVCGYITQAGLLHQKLISIPGVVETGLFLNMADLVILGNNDGTTRMLRKQEKDV